MTKGIRKLNITFVTVLLCLAFSVTAFARDEVRYSNELTVTPIRIFFVILAIVGFVVLEMIFEKYREKRIAKRNNKKDK